MGLLNYMKGILTQANQKQYSAALEELANESPEGKKAVELLMTTLASGDDAMSRLEKLKQKYRLPTKDELREINEKEFKARLKLEAEMDVIDKEIKAKLNRINIVQEEENSSELIDKKKVNAMQKDCVMNKQFLVEANFIKIGEYLLQNNDMIRINITEEKLKEKKKLVYAFVIDDLVKYIGKTKGGYYRPLSYHKDYNNSDKNRDVHNGIRQVISDNKTIEIFARIFKEDDNISIINNEKIKINPYAGYEEALINKFNPEWNIEK